MAEVLTDLIDGMWLIAQDSHGPLSIIVQTGDIMGFIETLASSSANTTRTKGREG